MGIRVEDSIRRNPDRTMPSCHLSPHHTTYNSGAAGERDELCLPNDRGMAEGERVAVIVLPCRISARALCLPADTGPR